MVSRAQCNDCSLGSKRDVQAPFNSLGTDGFGRSDTRSALRDFFEVDRYHIVLAALAMVDTQAHAKARAQYGIDAVDDAPWHR